MSTGTNNREGLSPPLLTPAELAAILMDDEDDDGIEYEPASETSEDTFGTADEEEDENEYLGTENISGTVVQADNNRCRGWHEWCRYRIQHRR